MATAADARTLGWRIRELRQSKGLEQAELARRVGRLPQDVYKWEKGRRVPSELVPDIAGALGISICELYGVDEGHGVPITLRLADQVAEILGTLPERVEVRIYGGNGSGEPAADFQPSKADWDTKQLLEEWAEMAEPQRQKWIDFADAIRGTNTQ